MPYYDVANLVTVTKANMINQMTGGYGTLRSTGVRIWHHVSHRACAEVSAALKFEYSNSQFYSILNTPPLLQVYSEAHENALAESESTL